MGSTVVINSTLKESGIAANEAADLEISDSELLNTDKKSDYIKESIDNFQSKTLEKVDEILS